MLLQVASTSFISTAFYVALSWNTTSNVKQLGLSPATGQYMTIVILAFNSIGYVVIGHLLDTGVPALTMYMAALPAVTGLSFAMFASMGTTLAATYIIVSGMLLLAIGIAQVPNILALTRLYAPLDRSTGHSLALQAAVPQRYKRLAPAFWIMAMAVPGLAATVVVCRYRPRLNQPYLARLA